MSFVRSPGPRVSVGLAVVVIVTIGLIDYATGPILSLSVFYMVPSAWATVQAGRKAGFTLAALSGLCAVTADVITQPHYHHRVVATWNSVLMVITLGVIVELIGRVRHEALSSAEAERRSKDFLASAAHQLRTPLAGIRSTVDAMLLAGNADGDTEQLLANLSREAARTGRQVGSLLRVARLDQHEAVPLRDVDVAAVVRAEVERAAGAHPALRWELDAEPDHIAATCNPDAISEALANLLDNASRHAVGRITLTIRATDGWLEIGVRDDGPGLPAGLVESAFERFVSLDGRGGTGLGLPIARGIAESHGGTLSVRAGAFVIRLPHTPSATSRAKS